MRLSDPVPTPRRVKGVGTAIGRARGRHRAYLLATCAALVLAAIGDEATGYDGPGPFVYPAFAVAVALARWRFTPLLAAAMSVFFLVGGLADPAFAHRLVHPDRAGDFTAGWLQMLGFAAAAVFAVAAVVRAGRTTRSRRAHS